MIDAGLVAKRLGFDVGTIEQRYVEALDGIEPLDSLDSLEPAAASELLSLLGVPPEDAVDVIATLPDPERTPEWWWCVERAAGRLVADMGDVAAPRGYWPSFEGPRHDLARRCHLFHVALAVLPRTVAYYEHLGVPAEVAWEALGDVARHGAIHRQMHGITGIEAGWWITLSLRGELVELGRLQYNRFKLGVSSESPIWYSPAESAARGSGFRTGDACLGIHIPAGAPLRPELVEESLERAGRFFREHFPIPAGERRMATCYSWLLDPELAAYLRAGSNILSFQRRFELVPASSPGDVDVLQFVFRLPELDRVDLDSLPKRTTMQRAAVAHLQAGRHWAVRTGWLDLPG